MRTAMYEPVLPSLEAGLLQDRSRLSRDGAVAPPAERWHSQVFGAPPPRRIGRKRATRYERFTTRMVLVSSLIMFGVTACLHLFNYGLETVTSSTSGTHQSFSKDNEE